MNREEKMVITGMGVISPLGHTLKDYWDNLISGKCGIKRIKCFDTSDLPTKIGGEIDDFDPLLYMDKKTAKRSARFTQFSLAVVQQALEDANLDIDDENQDKIGIYVGSSLCGFEGLEKEFFEVYLLGLHQLPVLTTIKYCNHSPAYTVAFHYHITGPTVTISSACNSSANALEIAEDQIRLGKIDKAIVIGVETLSEYSFKGFCQGRAMSTRNEMPAEASRPFDRDRDGFVVSEGAGAIILEREDDAHKRGIKPYTKLAGYANTNDAYSLLQCEPTGREMARAMVLALENAKIPYDKISYVSAHGPSMRDTDRAETRALKQVFGSNAYKLQVSSIKGGLGSPLGATNILQIISTCLSINQKNIPPTINYETQDPECDLDYVPKDARDLDISHALINSHAYGGGNSSIVLASI